MTVDIEPAGLGSAADHAHELASDRAEHAAAMAIACDLLALHDRHRAAWLRRQAWEWRRGIVWL